jgi:hypothetical protein
MRRARPVRNPRERSPCDRAAVGARSHRAIRTGRTRTPLGSASVVWPSAYLMSDEERRLRRASNGGTVGYNEARRDFEQRPALVWQVQLSPFADSASRTLPAVEGLIAPPIPFVGHIEGLEIQRRNRVRDEERQVPFRKPVAGRGREQQRLVGCTGCTQCTGGTCAPSAPSARGCT